MGRRSKADERRTEILGHLYIIIKSKGLDGATISNIADSMGVNPSLIIHYFKTKDEMLVEMVDFLLTRYEETYLAELDQVKDPEQRFDMVLNIVLGDDWLDVSSPEVFYACHYMSFQNPQMKARFREMYDWFKDLIMNEIKIWINKGIIAENDAEQVAEFIITLNEGSTYLWTIWSDRDQYRKRGQFLKSMVINMLQNLKVPVYI